MMASESIEEAESRGAGPSRSGAGGFLERVRGAAPDFIPRAIGFAVPFSLVLYLGLESGGYEVDARGQAGILAWWFLLVFTLIGVLPLARVTARSWVATGLMAAFGIWTFIGLAWTDSAERTFVEGSRVVTLLGVLALSVFIQGRGGLDRTVGGVGAGIAVIALVGLLSRLQPDLFPNVPSLDLIIGAEYRLSYPLGYWNGLAALCAVGLPLAFRASASAAGPVIRGFSSVGFLVLTLTLFYTFSRAGLLAGLLAFLVLFILTPRRLELLVRGLVPLLGSGLLLLAAESRSVLSFGRLGPEYSNEANEMTIILVAVAVVVGLAQAGLAAAERRGMKFSLTPARRVSLVLLGGAVVALVVLGLVFDAPGRTSEAWNSFRENTNELRGSDRLLDPSGNGRFELWSSAFAAWESSPIGGIGAGTFEYWWNQNGPLQLVVRDAHSLYLEVLGEQGIIGFVLLVSLLGLVVWTGATTALRQGASNHRRQVVAASTAGVIAFMVSAGLDWNWELAVTPAAALLIGGALLAPSARDERPINSPEPVGPGWGLAPKLGTLVASLLAIGVLALDVTGSALIERSQEEFREGRATDSLSTAREASQLQPWASGPDLQQAYVLASLGEYGQAIERATEATEKDPQNWRAWLVLAQVADQAEKESLALRAIEQARQKNPRSSLWNKPGG